MLYFECYVSCLLCYHDDTEEWYADDGFVVYVFVTQRGMTALMHAVCNDHMESVKVLLAAGADVTHQDKVSDCAANI